MRAGPSATALLACAANAGDSTSPSFAPAVEFGCARVRGECNNSVAQTNIAQRRRDSVTLSSFAKADQADRSGRAGGVAAYMTAAKEASLLADREVDHRL